MEKPDKTDWVKYVMNWFRSISESMIMKLEIMNLPTFMDGTSLCNNGIIYMVIEM